jgi:hypothetical protein
VFPTFSRNVELKSALFVRSFKCPVDRTPELSLESSLERPLTCTLGCSLDRSPELSLEYTLERPFERSGERSGEVSTGHSIECPFERSFSCERLLWRSLKRFIIREGKFEGELMGEPENELEDDLGRGLEPSLKGGFRRSRRIMCSVLLAATKCSVLISISNFELASDPFLRSSRTIL